MGRQGMAVMLGGVAGAIAFAPSVAVAQGPATPAVAQAPAPAPRGVGDDVIHLKDGGMVRGTIVDALPGAQARIQLVTGEVDTIPWQSIARIERAGVPAVAAAEPAAESDRYEVWLHLEASEGVVVQQDVTNDDDWQTVCEAPCDKSLPTAFHYRVTGSGIRASNDFTLTGARGSHERLVVHTASTGAFVLGIVGMVGGVVVGYVGLIVADVGALASSFNPSDQSLEGTGLAMMGVGAVAAVGGLIVTLSNGRTRVTHEPAPGEIGAVRAPAWADLRPSSIGAVEGRSLPHVTGLPLLSGRF